MSRAEFLATLRAGLRGAPQAAVDEIIADYSAHFDEGIADNRNEAEIAAALGEPRVIAGELRMEMRVENFEAAPSVKSGLQVLTGALTQGIVSFFLLIAAALMLLIVPVAAMVIGALAGAGGWFLFDGASFELPGGISTTLLCGIGLIAAAVSLTAFLMLAGNALVRAVGRHARLRVHLVSRSSQPGIPP